MQQGLQPRIYILVLFFCSVFSPGIGSQTSFALSIKSVSETASESESAAGSFVPPAEYVGSASAKTTLQKVTESIRNNVIANYMLGYSGGNFDSWDGVKGEGSNLYLEHYFTIGWRINDKWKLEATLPLYHKLTVYDVETSTSFYNRGIGGMREFPPEKVDPDEKDLQELPPLPPKTEGSGQADADSDEEEEEEYDDEEDYREEETGIDGDPVVLNRQKRFQCDLPYITLTNSDLFYADGFHLAGFLRYYLPINRDQQARGSFIDQTYGRTKLTLIPTYSLSRSRLHLQLIVSYRRFFAAEPIATSQLEAVKLEPTVAFNVNESLTVYGLVRAVTHRTHDGKWGKFFAPGGARDNDFTYQMMELGLAITPTKRWSIYPSIGRGFSSPLRETSYYIYTSYRFFN